MPGHVAPIRPLPVRTSPAIHTKRIPRKDAKPQRRPEKIWNSREGASNKTQPQRTQRTRRVNQVTETEAGRKKAQVVDGATSASEDPAKGGEPQETETTWATESHRITREEWTELSVCFRVVLWLIRAVVVLWDFCASLRLWRRRSVLRASLCPSWWTVVAVTGDRLLITGHWLSKEAVPWRVNRAIAP